MWTHPLTISIVAALAAIVGSMLTIFLSPRLQHHFWKHQRRDELRLAAIGEFNRLTNVYVAACLVTSESRPVMSEWLRDFNIAGSTIRALFPDRAYQAARKVGDMITPYATWDAESGQERKRRADRFADECQAALAALYREVVTLERS